MYIIYNLFYKKMNNYTLIINNYIITIIIKIMNKTYCTYNEQEIDNILKTKYIQVGDYIKVEPNNQLGIKVYKVIIHNNIKSVIEIGDGYGLYE